MNKPEGFDDIPTPLNGRVLVTGPIVADAMQENAELRRKVKALRACVIVAIGIFIALGIATRNQEHEHMTELVAAHAKMTQLDTQMKAMQRSLEEWRTLALNLTDSFACDPRDGGEMRVEVCRVRDSYGVWVPVAGDDVLNESMTGRVAPLMRGSLPAYRGPHRLHELSP